MTWTLGNSPVGDLEYSYDADGHVTGKTGSLAQSNDPTPVSGNAFNAGNEMTTFGAQALTYDSNGNLTNDGTNTYTWDARNHLSAISGPKIASVVYDAFGRRASKTINATVTQFLYDGLNAVQELNGANPPNATAILLTGLGIDEFFTRTDSTATMAFLADALGSTVALTNSGGGITTSYAYEAFGNTVAAGPANSNPYQFTGRENDGTGLYFYRARYYSPGFQRFIAQDPIDFNSGTANLYEYVGSSPIMSDDPSGMLGPITALTGAIGGGIAGAAGAALSGGGGWAISTGVFGGIITGGVVGFFDPGPLVASFVGASAGVLGDIATQLATGGTVQLVRARGCRRRRGRYRSPRRPDR